MTTSVLSPPLTPITYEIQERRTSLPAAAAAWQAVQDLLRWEMPPKQFAIYIQPCVGHKWVGYELLVAVNSSYSVSWLSLPIHQGAGCRVVGEPRGGGLRRLFALYEHNRITVAGQHSSGSRYSGIPAAPAVPQGRQRTPSQLQRLGRFRPPQEYRTKHNNGRPSARRYRYATGGASCARP